MKQVVSLKLMPLYKIKELENAWQKGKNFSFIFSKRKKESVISKFNLFINVTMVDAAIRFISSNKSKEKLKSSSDNINEDNKEGSKEPDYNEDEDQLEEKQEEKTGEM
jgi:hypothetical protein